MVRETTSNIVIKPSALVAAIAAIIMALLGFMLKGAYNDIRNTDKRQWEIIGELRQDVSALKAKVGN